MARVLSRLKPMTIKGKSIFLRKLDKTDEAAFCCWYKDPEVTKFLAMDPMNEDKSRVFFNETLADRNGSYFAIVTSDDVKTIGYVFLSGILKRHHVARECGIIIGEKTFWGRGYGTEAIRLILDYGFKTFGLHRIELLVVDFNKRAQAVYRKLGFVEEGMLREARLVDGCWRDVYLMAILEPNSTL
jgi:RimJ/RimL family protein N-acetyltransferase